MNPTYSISEVFNMIQSFVFETDKEGLSLLTKIIYEEKDRYSYTELLLITSYYDIVNTINA